MDELAKILPVLSEDEQRECVGSEYYYSLSGNYLGQIGSNEDIRVIDMCCWNDHKENPDELFSSSTALGVFGGGPIRQNILTDAIRRFGMSSSGAQVAPGTSIGGQVAKFDKDGITLNSNSMFYNNVADIRLAIVHEQAHKNDPATSKDTEYTLAKKEYSAYWAAKMSPYFSQASPGARKVIEDQIEYQNKIIKKYEE